MYSIMITIANSNLIIISFMTLQSHVLPQSLGLGEVGLRKDGKKKKKKMFLTVG
jgi:hypothetical protein